jgi:hypothetical protein
VPLFLRGRGGQTLAAFAAYVALTIAMTWPIARGISRDVPADLGDALLNMWIMAWDSEALVAMASGRMSFAELWHGNIFHPSPLSLTFSEHLLPQAVQGLPVYLATGNIVLAYNLVFLATFALSGLGMFLFVRELTGQARVAFVAGLFFAFVPYRLGGQFPHIQTISSQWMPFALFGLRRYFDSGRLTALAGGVAAFVVQGLSTGYYLFFFAPVLGGYVLWEMVVRRAAASRPDVARDDRAAVVAVGASLPFLLPYLERPRHVRVHAALRRSARTVGGPLRLPERTAAAVLLGAAPERSPAARRGSLLRCRAGGARARRRQPLELAGLARRTRAGAGDGHLRPPRARAARPHRRHARGRGRAGGDRRLHGRRGRHDDPRHERAARACTWRRCSSPWCCGTRRACARRCAPIPAISRRSSSSPSCSRW